MKTYNPLIEKILKSAVLSEEQKNEIIQIPPMSPPSQSECVRNFVKRFEQAKERGEKVLIAGDYDADGVFSTSILCLALKKAGIQTGFYLPNRIKEGYGLRPETVQKAYDRGYSLIITVDNGIKAYDAIALAKELGVDMIVTDHHTIEQQDKENPDGESRENLLIDIPVVHPDYMEEQFSTLCGAGVIYECIRALGLDDDQMLCYAACASVTDCMPVFHQTRAIVQNGLKILNTKGEPHLEALNQGKKVLNENVIGFQIGPKINACGRLSEQANVNNVVRFLTMENTALLDDFARQLDQVNIKRKQLTEGMMAQVNRKIRLTRPLLFCADSNFHEGIIGLAAGRLCHQTDKPVIVGKVENNLVKCSMRSPKGFDCMEFLKDWPHFTACGGHARAAGFSLEEKDCEDFEKYCLERMKTYEWTLIQKPRVYICEEECTIENIQALDALRPFGTDFEQPLFVLENPQISSVFDLCDGEHRKFRLEGGMEVLNFHQSEFDMNSCAKDIASFAGSLDINSFRNMQTPQMIAEEIEYENM